MESQAIGLVAAVVDDPRVAVVVVTLVNLASVLVALLWAHRLGGLPLLAGVAVVAGALLWSLRGPILVTPFNPYVAVLPLLACMASLVAATDGQPWSLTTAVLFGSWGAQAHLTATGPIVGAAVGAAAAAALTSSSRWRQRRPGTEIHPDRRRLLAGIGVLAACWAFPLSDALLNEGGNVRAIFAATGSLDQETLGAGGAVDIVVQALAVRPVWAQAGASSLDLLSPPSGLQQVVAAALVASAAAVAGLSRVVRPWATAGVLVPLAALVVGGALTARIPQSLFNAVALHNYLWLWPVTALLWLAVLAGLVRVAADRLEVRPPGAVIPVTAVAVLAVVAVASVGPLHRGSGTALSTYVRAVTPAVVDALEPDGRYLVDLDPAIGAYGIGTGLLHHLEVSGFDVRVPERFESSFGDHRVDDGEDRDVLVVRTGRAAPTPTDPTAEPIAAYRPPRAVVDERGVAEQTLVHEIRRRGGTAVVGARIEPADADDWVRSGGFVDALRLRLVDPSLATLPAARRLAALDEEPSEHVVVYLVPRAGAGRASG